jgi:hypothetical protein
MGHPGHIASVHHLVIDYGMQVSSQARKSSPRTWCTWIPASMQRV